MVCIFHKQNFVCLIFLLIWSWAIVRVMWSTAHVIYWWGMGILCHDWSLVLLVGYRSIPLFCDDSLGNSNWWPLLFKVDGMIVGDDMFWNRWRIIAISEEFRMFSYPSLSAFCTLQSSQFILKLVRICYPLKVRPYKSCFVVVVGFDTRLMKSCIFLLAFHWRLLYTVGPSFPDLYPLLLGIAWWLPMMALLFCYIY